MPADIQLRGRNKHNLISGDFIMILAVILGFLLTGGFFVRTSRYPNQDQGFYETEIIVDKNASKSALQLETFTIKRCANNTAVDFLIDNSGSMQFGTKMAELKRALTMFADKFSPSGAIAFQTYSESVKTRLEFSLFKDSKSKFLSEVASMKPLTATHSRDAFIIAQDSLNKGKTKFPQHKFALIFISDGIPETKSGNDACPGGIGSEYCMEHPLVKGECRCYDVNQDPRDIATQIKSSGTRIFTIAFTDDLADAYLDAKLQLLMRDLASSPEDYYHAPIESQLTNIINQIANIICAE